MQKIYSLTSLRFFLAVWVICRHLSSALQYELAWTKNGYLAVDVFFILSGFILSYCYDDKIKTISDYFLYLIKRIARIYPAYFVTTAFFIIYNVINAYINQEPDKLMTSLTIKNLLMIQSWFGFNPSLNYPAWSISTEFLAYIVILPFCFFILNKAKIFYKILWLLLSIGALCLYINHYHATAGLSTHGFNVYTHMTFFRILPAFILGNYICHIYKKGIQIKYAHTFLLLTIILFFFVAESKAPLDILIYPLSFLLILSLLNITGIVYKFFSTRSLVFLGEASYCIYLAQAINIQIFSALIKMNVIIVSNKMFMLVMLLLTIILTGIGLYIYVEKPMRKKILTIAENAAKPSAATLVHS
ncbi:MAG: hypothetical protein DKM50_08900 [Candidatus Margulisiibacteriota bacterium]|nr:MAG: hypothetical protein A2X43_04480 [Candidatus Margulisbacteria bacterium GWD2_39_127]OGI04126.1 MAG: hypothetical protein A2X42_04685 [Candidatus Margulisbacteria bacterium GWF2_38_17]OGI05977.1 MAG: hypothetical protein A2X41_12195 [Candidatus Margulisbacteria bacterium GWE2_39_32]PZM79567.1 MAG: hypothetical protein DKM50_08900 [Candidatus Margulisiibacteriota bacterium]HAR63381.1 hypothetical protein [Candidatus Margulisiibacteriota bacterium]